MPPCLRLPPSCTHFTRFALAAALALLAVAPAGAQTLRWASQGDPQTMDPYSQNEGLTNMVNGQVYEFLVARDRRMNLVPGLATEWRQDSPTKWTFKLRRGVKFHDGRPFTADDVVFSINRAREKTSQIAVYAAPLGEVRKLDDHAVEFDLPRFDPVFLQHVNLVYIMSRSWCVEHHAEHPQNFTAGEETWTALHATGTGPYVLESRQPDVRTVLRRNPDYWQPIAGNVQQVVYTPIRNAGTRVAALLSHEVDFVLDPPPSDLGRLRADGQISVVDGMENRIVFIGMDQARDQLLYASVKGRNPFKDERVRRAMYEAIDIEAIRTRLMNGQALPTGAMAPTPKADFGDPALEKRLPYDVAGAKRLLAEAGYPDGFEVTLDCPNNRYINDERICIALASMWAKIDVKVRVNAMPRATYFPKLDKLDTSLYMLGWGGPVDDAETIFTPVMRNRGADGVGAFNYGNSRDDVFDRLAAASTQEPDPARRSALIRQAFAREHEQVHLIPLHRQVIPWAMWKGVSVVHRPDNWLEVSWITMK